MLRPHDFTAYWLHFDGSRVTPEELHFLLAMHAYQKRFRRRYPTWREVLLVARSLGYRKVAPAAPVNQPPQIPPGVRPCCSRAS
jgi:hypothetical protein